MVKVIILMCTLTFMVSTREHSILKRMYSVVKREGVVESLDLQDFCGRMSISTYNKLKRPFLKIYQDKIGFQKQGDNHMFYDLHPTLEKQEHLVKELITIDS